MISISDRHENKAINVTGQSAPQALHADALTRLPDHLLLLERLEHAISNASEDQRTLLFLGLGNFAQINESLGHTIGDEVLSVAAQRIDSTVNRPAMVAHHSGGKFLILLEGTTQYSETLAVANSLITALAAPVAVGDQALVLTPCIGISVYPADGKNAATLFDQAGAAMYRAIKRGSAGFLFCGDESGGADSPDPVVMASSPRPAIRHEPPPEQQLRPQQLQEANQRLVMTALKLKEADTRRDEFLGMLAHELRNPLAPIATGAAILERIKAEPRVAQVAQVIHRQVNHLRRLVDDLLDVSRFTRGKIALVVAPFKLRETVETAVEMLDDGMKEHECSVELSPATEKLSLVGDQVRIVQVLTNLLDNACKFSPPRTRIRILADASDGWLRLRVVDQGAGVDPAFMPQVFEPFAQYEPVASHGKGGLGMGLTLAREIAKLHGGDLRAYSAGLGKGTEFVLEIPARPG